MSYFSISIFAISCAKDIVDLTGDIQGSVKDYDSGKLIENCRVSLSPGGKSTSTDANGAFSFEDLDAGTYTLSFSKSGYGDETQDVSVVTGQTSKVNVFLKLPSATTGKIAGIIKDYKNGQIISNCNVSITPSGKSVTSSSSGTFEFSDLTPGQYSISFTKAGYFDENTTVTVTAGHTTTADALLKAKSSFAISETSYDFGDLEVSKTFYFFNYSDADCAFTIQNIPAWLSFNKTTGTVTASGNEAVTATVDRSKESEGTYSQNITLSYSGKESGTTNLAIKMKKVVLSAPSVSIASSGENIKQNAFDISGSITATGGSQITGYGHCWNASGNPTINDKHTDLGTTDQILTFKNTADNLSTYTTYYVRAYAQNAQGITYSDVISVTTQDVASDKWDGNIATSFASGSGTYIDPYIIKTGGQLLLAKNYSDKYFELGGNIDLDNHNWLPYEFSGTLNGAGYSISKLNITGRSTNEQGLFSSLSGRVNNLTIKAASISANNNRIGAIAGSLSGTISNCVVYVEKITGNSCVGGIVGYASDGSNISSCKVLASSSSAIVRGNEYVGGICGYVQSSYKTITIAESIVSINLKGSTNVGGITGFLSTSYNQCDISKCGYEGSISGEQYLGGIVGRSQGAKPLVISQSYSDIKITADKGYAGGIRGSSGDVYAEVTIISCYTKGEINCSGTLSIGGIMGQRNQSGGSSSYLIYHSYSTVTSSQGNEFNGFSTCGWSYDCATVSTMDSSRTTNCKVECLDIAAFMKDCYSEFSSHWNYSDTWLWTGLINGTTKTVKCPKLSDAVMDQFFIKNIII